jgi:hypothetical protein
VEAMDDIEFERDGDEEVVIVVGDDDVEWIEEMEFEREGAYDVGEVDIV